MNRLYAESLANAVAFEFWLSESTGAAIGTKFTILVVVLLITSKTSNTK